MRFIWEFILSSLQPNKQIIYNNKNLKNYTKQVKYIKTNNNFYEKIFVLLFTW